MFECSYNYSAIEFLHNSILSPQSFQLFVFDLKFDFDIKLTD